MNNLARLLVDRCDRRPGTRVGTVEQPLRLEELLGRAERLAAVLLERGIGVGSRVLVVGPTSTEYLCWWVALQLAGCEAALTHPGYPVDLITEMALALRPDAALWLGTASADGMDPRTVQIEVATAPGGLITVDGAQVVPDRPADRLPGLDRHELDLAGFMHTSGTNGTPKYCAQTHAYFLRLGRLVADRLALSSHDTVFAPLPMAHINPLGYGLIGGLIGGADVLGAERFSASAFWSCVHAHGITALVLHAPPVEILKRATTPEEAAGHHVRAVFYTDLEFLERFGIPFGLSAYGSTEAGGVTHLHAWRRGDTAPPGTSVCKIGGTCRPDVEWRLSDGGEILVRELRSGSLFGGYLRDGAICPATDGDGWFATGDLGSVDGNGELIFLERLTQSIRVKGEFVPIEYVERHFAALDSVDEAVLTAHAGSLDDVELVLYVVAEVLDARELHLAAGALPAFMRPVVVRRVAALPRDPAVGKVRRRELAGLEALEEVSIEWTPARTR